MTNEAAGAGEPKRDGALAGLRVIDAGAQQEACSHRTGNGADRLCETLLAGGIEVCFANPGTSEMHFVAALDRQPRMRCVLGLFEGVVTGAADGYARMADKPAATLLHLGPGLANGLANLHNARRAHSPIVNIVGNHATYHLAHDAPLTSDIEGLARPMSHWVRTTQRAEDVAQDAAAAIAAANTPPGQIATLILPADAAWGAVRQAVAPVAAPTQRAQVSAEAVRAAAAALRKGRSTLLMLSGQALRERPLRAAGRIAAATGARLMAQQSNARIARGAGRVAIDRTPHKVEQALAALADVAQVILVGARAPVAFFAYPGLPSRLTPPGCAITEFAPPAADLEHALEWLADEVGAADAVPQAPGARPEAPGGALTVDSISRAIGALLPEQAIVCDESITSGRDLFRHTHHSAPHDFLQLTGGAIGEGLPMALGAAVACPDRKVVCLQADGSGMYTNQALWSHAREALDIVTVVFANRSYAILHGELRNVGAGEPGPNARRMLDLDAPALDWVALANGMGVEAARADGTERFCDLLRSALARRGPFLIEALL